MKDFFKYIFQKLPFYREKQDASGWFGNYSSYQALERECSGYSKDSIFEKVKSATLKVKRGEAAFERDSITFETLEYDADLLNFFTKVIAENNSQLSVLDFGGSLGSVYFQYRQLLQKDATIRWCIVEQKHFIDFGKKELETNELKFYHSIEQCLAVNSINLVLLSSVLSYLEEPYVLLDKISRLEITYLVIDKNLFLKNEERLTKQIVPKEIYEAEYPCWILNETKLLNLLSPTYELVAELDPYAGTTVDLGDKKAYFKGIILKRK